MLHRRATFAVVVCVALAGAGVPRAHTCPQSGRLIVRSLPEAAEERQRKSPQKAEETDRRVSPANPGVEQQETTGDDNGEHETGALGDKSAAVAGVVAAEPHTPWMTAEQAAEYTRLHVETLHRYAREGLLKRGGIPGAIRYHRDDLDEFLREQGKRWRRGHL